MVAERVLITGASAGIGWSTAEAFAREGSEIYLVARREERLRELAERCRALGSPKVECGSFDLGEPGQGAASTLAGLDALGGLDVLVCNAGYGHWGPVTEVSAQDMRRMWQVNYQSAYEAIQVVLPEFRKRRSGHVVLVSSVLGRKGMPYSAAYSATKFAQVGLAEALWGELLDDGVGVSVICPGYTATEFHDVSSPGRSKQRPIKGQAPAVVARALVKAVRRRKRSVHLTLAARFLLLVDRISRGAACRLLYWTAKLERRR